MNFIQAKQTTYKGVKYRSKSEAKLAVCLDSWGHKYTYEPNISVDNWTPDFLVTHRSGFYILIEYKPCIPNGEYINQLADRFGTILRNDLKTKKNRPLVVCELWCIDFWKNTVNGLRFKSESELMVIDHELRRLDFTPANRFRFDLHGLRYNWRSK